MKKIILLLTAVTTLGLNTATIAQNWTSVSVIGNIQKIAFNQQIGIAVGDNGTILKTTDGGLTFNPVVSGINDNLMDIKYVGNNSFITCGWIWGSHGVVLKSTDNGSTWNSVISLNGQFNEMFGLFSFNSDTIFVSGTNQLIRTFNGFSTYSTSNFPNGYQYRSLFFNNNLILLAHAGTVIMRKSSDFGGSYTNSTIQPTSNMLRDMAYINNQLFAIGDNGSFCTSADGDSWNMVTTQNLNFKSIHALAGMLYTCTSSEVFELNPNGNLTSSYIANGINSTGTSLVKLFALGNNFIAYKSICQLSLNSQPASQLINFNTNAQFSVGSSDPNASYQWQTDLGVGFQNLNSVGQYSGTTNDTLTILNVTMSNNNQPFRCIISSGSCTDTSNVAVLTVNNNTGINEVSQSNLFSVYPNPANSQINVKANAKLLGSIYTVYDNTGKLVLTGKINSENTVIELGNLSGGIYLFSVGENLKQTFKVIKE